MRTYDPARECKPNMESNSPKRGLIKYANRAFSLLALINIGKWVRTLAGVV